MLPLWADEVNGVRVVRLTGPDEAGALVSLFERIAQAEGWQPGGALRRWADRSVYFALEVGGQLAGGLQLVLPDPQGTLPCHEIWTELPPDLMGRTAHVAVLALDGPFRGDSALFWSLGIEMWRVCVEAGIATLTLEAVPRVLPLYRRLGWPLAVRGDLREHWGEDCYLCSLDLPEVAEAILRRAERSPSYRRIVAQAFRLAMPAHNRWEATPEEEVALTLA